MKKTVIINNQHLSLRSYNGQKVVTFKDIDSVHGRSEGTAHRNFKTNKKRFVEGVDFFRRNSSEAKKEFGISAPNGLILITESGYLMLAKSFTDDLAWQIQRELVNVYFRSVKRNPIQNHFPKMNSSRLKPTNTITLIKHIKENLLLHLRILNTSRVLEFLPSGAE